MSGTVYKSKFKSRWTILGLTAMVLATTLLTLGFLDTIARGDTKSSVAMMLPLIFLAIGFPLGNALHGGFRVDPKFPEVTSTKILVLMSASAGAILFVNLTKNFAEIYGATGLFVVPSLSIVSLAQFAVLMAVSEEIFFRYFITRYVSNISTNQIAWLVSASFFTAYHFWRYGPFLPILMVTFFSGLILAWAYTSSGMPSTVILPHMVINYMSFMSPTALFLSTIVLSVSFFIIFKGRMKFR